MVRIQTLDGLENLTNSILDKKKNQTNSSRGRIIISMGSCGVALGAQKVKDAFVEEMQYQGITDVKISLTGCAGQCDREPLVYIEKDSAPTAIYEKVTPEIAKNVFRAHFQGRLLREKK